MSKTTRFILIFSIFLALIGSLTGIFTFRGCTPSDDGDEPTGFNVNYYVNTNVAEGESVETYLSIDDEEFLSVENQTLTTYANVKKLKVYFVAENPENVRTATLSVGDQIFDVSVAVSSATAYTVNITASTDVELTLIVQPGFTVNANAVLRRNTGSAGGLLFVSVNGGEFEQFADLSATDVGTTKTVTDELSEVYALAFYTTVNEDSLLTSATYDFGGSDENFGESTSPATATVLTISEQTEINFDLLFRPFGYSVTLNQLTTGNTASGVSISIDGGTFTNYYGNQDDVLIEQYATTLDFYFIYDAATVDEKTAFYYYYDDGGEEVEVNFVNSTHENPVHIDLTANFTLITETYANIEEETTSFLFTTDITKTPTRTQYYTFNVNTRVGNKTYNQLAIGGIPSDTPFQFRLSGGGEELYLYNGFWLIDENISIEFIDGADIENANMKTELLKVGIISD